MYLPAHFREDRPDVLDAFLVAHPLGLLVTVQNGLPTIDPVPMRLEVDPSGQRRLRGHVARANPAANAVVADTPVLVIFGGANHYLSPAWYASKQVDGKVVPTWNYSIVEARGRLRWFHDAAELLTLVGQLTTTYESPRAEPWAVSDAPSDYIDGMLRAIVGFEIVIESMIGKFKASQNRHAVDRAGASAGLAADGVDAAAVAELVRAPRG